MLLICNIQFKVSRKLLNSFEKNIRKEFKLVQNIKNKLKSIQTNYQGKTMPILRLQSNLQFGEV